MRTAAHRDTPGGPVFLCLWANMWSESVQPYPTSRNCHENGRTESDNADFHDHKSALILRAACALVHTKNMLSLIGTMASAGGGTLAASIGAAKIGAATGTTIHPGIGTAIGVGGGLIGGAIGGTAVKALGDKIREDDSIILSRMFNGVLLNLIYEYMLQETEIDVLIEKLNSIKTKEFKKLFKDLISAKSQDKTIDNFVRHYFEEIIRSRPVIAEPSADDLVELLKQFDTDIDITANTP